MPSVMSKPDLKRIVNCVDIDGNWHQTTADMLVFRPSVYGVIIRDGKILLAKQTQGYDFPGGGIEKSELIADALVREVKEETGVDVSVGGLVTVETSLFRGNREDNHQQAFFQSILIYYRCDYIGGELTTDNFDEYEKSYGEMPEWVPLDKLADIRFASSIDCHEVVRKALAF